MHLGAFKQEKVLVGAFSMIVKLLIIFGNLRFKLYCVAEVPGTGDHVLVLLPLVSSC